MKKYLGIIFFVCSSAFALEPGQCEAIPGTKKYTQADFSAAYPKTVKFICDYKCKSVRGESLVSAESTVEVHSLGTEAKVMVCQGVVVNKNSFGGYDFSHSEKFFAYHTKMQEIKDWARAENISLNHPLAKPILEDLKEKLYYIGRTYLVAGTGEAPVSKIFLEAGKALVSAASELPSKTEQLDSLIENTKNVKHDIGKPTPEGLIKSVLSVHAYWRY